MTLARAVVELALFLETAGDDAVDPHAAARALAALGERLDEATPAEQEALLEAARAALEEREAAGAPSLEREFLARFGEVFGLRR